RRALNRLGVPLLNKPLKPGKLRAALSALLGEAQGASRGAGDGGRP
ncbi:hypothetical protein IGA92_26820, partial [Pseudomonas aeruginosa]|nr:hypothetical protein [Pseudomonas aeruginosa]